MMLQVVEKNGRKNMKELWADKVRNYTVHTDRPILHDPSIQTESSSSM
jgi:hypothetical protein